MNTAESEEFDTAVRDARAVETGKVPEERDSVYYLLREACQRIAMVIHQFDRFSWPNRVDIQIRKHLLGPLQASIGENDYRYCFISKEGAFPYCFFNRGSAML